MVIKKQIDKNKPANWPYVTAKIPQHIKDRVVTMAARAGIAQPEVVEQLIWGYLDHMEAAWERGEPIPPRPWRDLPMPKKPVDPRPTTVETDETSGLSEYLDRGVFPEDPEPYDPPAEEAPEALPVAGGGSTPVRRKRRG
jgi:hypothetical protein